MLRTILVIFLLGICALFFYQRQQPEQPAAPQPARHFEEHWLSELKRAVPQAIFEKDIVPALEKNKDAGFTPAQLDELLQRLETIGKALGDKAGHAVAEAIEGIAPDRNKDKKSGELSWFSHGAGQAGDGMPSWKKLAEDILNGLGGLLSRLLDGAADVLQKN